MRLLVVTCPIAQIFQERYHDRLIDNPDQIYSDVFIENGEKKKVQIIVPAGSMGPVTFTVGQPFPIGGKKGTDGDQDILALSNWLSGGEDGGRNSETDCYGIADLGLDDSASTAIMQEILSAGMSGKKADFSAVGSSVADRMKAAMARAEKISHERVMRTIRDIHRNYEDQNQKCEADNKTYHPSKAEWLCRYVLKKEIAEREERNKNFKKIFAEPLTDNIQGAPHG